MNAVAKRIWEEEEGQNMIEYGLIAGLISIAGLAALKILGPTLAKHWQTIADSITK